VSASCRPADADDREMSSSDAGLGRLLAVARRNRTRQVSAGTVAETRQLASECELDFDAVANSMARWLDHNPRVRLSDEAVLRWVEKAIAGQPASRRGDDDVEPDIRGPKICGRCQRPGSGTWDDNDGFSVWYLPATESRPVTPIVRCGDCALLEEDESAA
jgi:hypothetical protein